VVAAVDEGAAVTLEEGAAVTVEEGAAAGVEAGTAAGRDGGPAGGVAVPAEHAASARAPSRTQAERSGAATREACHDRRFHLWVPAALRCGVDPQDTR
jgi:hypothetical protein